MKVLITHDEIVEMCKRIGAELTNKFKGKDPVVICVLKGATPFHSELIKHIDTDIEVDYVQFSSYSGTNSTGKVKLKKDMDIDVTNKDVIVVEDIIDTGLTMKTFDDILKTRNAHSVTYVTLLDKPSRRELEFNADYVGRTIDNLFVVGFGLDLDEKLRNLKDIYIYDED